MTKSIVEQARLQVDRWKDLRAEGTVKKTNEFAQAVIDFAEALDFYADERTRDGLKQAVLKFSLGAIDTDSLRARAVLSRHGVKVGDGE